MPCETRVPGREPSRCHSPVALMCWPSRKAGLLDGNWASKECFKAHEQVREQWGVQPPNVGTAGPCMTPPWRGRMPQMFLSASHTWLGTASSSSCHPSDRRLPEALEPRVAEVIVISRWLRCVLGSRPTGAQQPGLAGQDCLCENLGSGNPFPQSPVCLFVTQSRNKTSQGWQKAQLPGRRRTGLETAL